MIRLISGKVACCLCRDESSRENYELYEYAIYIVISSLLHIATVIILGLIFSLLIESSLFYLSFIAVRKFAGGYHASAPSRCYLFSLTVSAAVLALMKLMLIYDSWGLRITAEAFGLVFLAVIICLSPLESENNPLNDREKRVYKKIAILNSIIIYIAAVVLMIFGLSNFSFSLLFGELMSAVVLLMRKVQMCRAAEKQTKNN